jgi:RNA polymerase sigma-70 factor (ECF subfamily)
VTDPACRGEAKRTQDLAPVSPRGTNAPSARGELDGLVRLLTADAAFYGDGGGKVVAFTRPITGADRVARLLAGIFVKFVATGIRVERAFVNGQPGAKFMDASDRVVSVWSLDTADGRVQCVRSVVNPEKLGHLGPVSDLLTLPANRPRDGLS